jgi:hypothetical protein
LPDIISLGELDWRVNPSKEGGTKPGAYGASYGGPVARIIIYKGGWTVVQYQPGAGELAVCGSNLQVSSFAV